MGRIFKFFLKFSERLIFYNQTIIITSIYSIINTGKIGIRKTGFYFWYRRNRLWKLSLLVKFLYTLTPCNFIYLINAHFEIKKKLSYTSKTNTFQLKTTRKEKFHQIKLHRPSPSAPKPHASIKKNSPQNVRMSIPPHYHIAFAHAVDPRRAGARTSPSLNLHLSRTHATIYVYTPFHCTYNTRT